MWHRTVSVWQFDQRRLTHFRAALHLVRLPGMVHCFPGPSLVQIEGRLSSVRHGLSRPSRQSGKLE